LSGIIGTLINNNQQIALQRTILFHLELRVNRCQTPPPPQRVKKIIKIEDRSYNNWTQVRLNQDQYLKNEKQKWEPIVIPTIETGSSETSLKRNP